MYVLCFKGWVSVSVANRYWAGGAYLSAWLTDMDRGVRICQRGWQIRTPRSIYVSRADRYGPPRDISVGVWICRYTGLGRSLGVFGSANSCCARVPLARPGPQGMGEIRNPAVAWMVTLWASMACTACSPWARRGGANFWGARGYISLWTPWTPRAFPLSVFLAGPRARGLLCSSRTCLSWPFLRPTAPPSDISIFARTSLPTP